MEEWTGYKTMRMWSYHPGIWGLMWLACIEAEMENTEISVLFLCLFNEALVKVKKQDGYRLNPYGIKCDENEANLNAVEEVFGRSFLTKTVTCQ